jgi:hypothetical protein
MSWEAILKFAVPGGVNRIDSCTTLHDSFIL